MVVGGDRRCKVLVVSLFYLKFTKLIIAGYHTKICFNVPTLFNTDDCNFASNLNIFTIHSALLTLEYDLFFEIMD